MLRTCHALDEVILYDVNVRTALWDAVSQVAQYVEVVDDTTLSFRCCGAALLRRRTVARRACWAASRSAA
jgi:hypothetical protein